MATEQDSHTRPATMASPHGTLGQFSYAPATQTTVVTTTTTTTTSFPPFVMNAPKQLKSRDPELYPLAASSTPKSMKKLRFELGGQLAVFEEADDVEHGLHEYEQLHSHLRSNSGTLRSTTASTSDLKPESNAPRQGTPNLKSSSRYKTGETEELRKRSVTPISISDDEDLSTAEAAELDSFHKRNQKRRLQHRHLKYEGSSRVDQDQKASFEWGSEVDGDVGHSSTNKRDKESSFRRPHASKTSRSRPRSRSRKHSRSHSHQSQDAVQTITGSATPPVRESDLGFFEPPRADRESRSRPNVPSAINTSPAQDASLPSPSLSPITAAANLNRASSSSRLRGGHTTVQTFPKIEHDTESFAVSRQRRVSPHLDLTGAKDVDPETHQLPTPSFTDIPNMLDTFDSMPDALKSYLMYQFLRRCAKPTLFFVAEALSPALKCDFIRRLPLELSQHILRYLDVKSMCRAAQVSRKWRHIVNSDEKAWKDLIDADGFELPEGEIQQAIEEGWGWQFPSRSGEWERDLRFITHTNHRSFEEVQSNHKSVTSTGADEPGLHLLSNRKRKSCHKTSSPCSKRQRRRLAREYESQATPWMDTIRSAQGPNAFASAAAAAVPNPKIGLRSLRSLHLFKSIYARHYQMRNSWLNADTKPRHLAFRARERHVVTCLQFDSEKILTGSDDAIIDIYDTKTGAQLKRLSGHEGGVWALEYEGNILVSGSTDRSVRVWNIEQGRCVQVFQGHTSTVRCLQIVHPTNVGTKADGTPIMMPKQPLIITGSRDSTCRVWKLPSLDDRSIFQAGPSAVDFDNPYFVRSLTGHTHSVRAIAAHCDTLVSGSYDASVRVWQISTGETLHRLQGHTTKVYSVVLDHQRRRCISGSMDNYVKVWSLETGDCLYNLSGHNSLVGLLDLKDDYLVSAAADSTLKIWDPESGQIQHTLRAHTGAITCFSHDGQKVISGSDRTLKMWNTKTGVCVRDLLTDLSGVWQVRFDERRCIAAVNRNDWTFIEVLDFGACRDGVPENERSRRIVVNEKGEELGEEADEEEEEEIDFIGNHPVGDIVEVVDD